MYIAHLPSADIPGIWIGLEALNLLGPFQILESRPRFGLFLGEKILVVVISALYDVSQKACVWFGCVCRPNESVIVSNDSP